MSSSQLPGPFNLKLITFNLESQVFDLKEKRIRLLPAQGLGGGAQLEYVAPRAIWKLLGRIILLNQLVNIVESRPSLRANP